MDGVTICRMEKEMKVALLARFNELNGLLDRLSSAAQEYKYFRSSPFFKELREACDNLQDFFWEFGQNVAVTITCDGRVEFRLVVNDGIDTTHGGSLFIEEVSISFSAPHNMRLS